MNIQTQNLLARVKMIKSSAARQDIPPECYQRSFRKTFFWFGFDMALFFAGMFLIFSNPSILLKLSGGFISGAATAMMFIWAHDAAHGALFKNSKIAEILGTITMLPSLNMYRMWS